MAKMTIMDYAEALTCCELWGGEKDPQKVIEMYSEEVLEALYTQMKSELAEYDE